MSDVDHTACVEALGRLQRTMNAAMARANEQIAASQAHLDRLDRANEALARTQMEMLRQIRNLLEVFRVSPECVVKYSAHKSPNQLRRADAGTFADLAQRVIIDNRT